MILRKGLKPLVPPLLVLCSIAIAFLMVQSRPALPRNDATAPLPQVQLLRVKKGDVPVMIRAQGTVTARRQLDLAADASRRGRCWHGSIRSITAWCWPMPASHSPARKWRWPMPRPSSAVLP